MLNITWDDKFGWFVTCVTVLFYSAPIFHFSLLFKGRIKYEDTPGTFILFNYLNTLIWFIFGRMLFSSPLSIPNLVSCIISGLFLLIYLGYEVKEYCIDAVLNFLIITSLSWTIYRSLYVIIDDDDVTYYTCLVSQGLVYLSPLALIYRVYKENNYGLFPIQSAYVALVSCPLFMVLAFKDKEYPTMGVFALGIVSSIIQILVRNQVKERCGKIIRGQEISNIVVDDDTNAPSSIEVKVKSGGEEGMSMEEKDEKENIKPVKIVEAKANE